jgi:hypothetical protein
VAYENWEIQRFSTAGIHLEPGNNPADRYTLEACVNLRIDESGRVVTRAGSRRVADLGSNNVSDLLVTTLNGMTTVVWSEDRSADGFYKVEIAPLIADGFEGAGFYSPEDGKYQRHSTGSTVWSPTPWRFAEYREALYLSAGSQIELPVGGVKTKVSSGMFRWEWFPTSPSWTRDLEDLGLDSMADLLEQDAALAAPTAAMVYSPTLTDRTTPSNRRLLEDAAYRNLGSIKSGADATVDDGSKNVGNADGLPGGDYFYYITYVRSDTLAESKPYEMHIDVTADDSGVLLAGIPEHPDDAVDLVRIYRNVSVTVPSIRMLVELQNGTASYQDDGQNLAIVGPALQDHAPPPQARVIHPHNGRMWYANTKHGGQVAFYSEFGEPGNVDLVDGWLALDSPQSGGITAMASTGAESDREAQSGMLLLFTQNGINVIEGDPPDIGGRVLSQSVGTPAYRTVKTYEGRVYFLAHDGVYATDGKEVVRISKQGALSKANIQARLDGVAANVLADACGAVAFRQYWLAVKDIRGNQVVYVFDIDNGYWVEHNYPVEFVDFAVLKTPAGHEKLYGLTTANGLHELNVGDRDENQAGASSKITSTFRLNPNWGGNHAQEKLYRIAHVGMQSWDDVTLRTYLNGTSLTHHSTSEAAAEFTIPADTFVGRWGDGSVWGDGTKWEQDTYERSERQPFPRAHVGHNLRLECERTGYLSVGSIAVQFERQKRRLL